MDFDIKATPKVLPSGFRYDSSSGAFIKIESSESLQVRKLSEEVRELKSLVTKLLESKSANL